MDTQRLNKLADHLDRVPPETFSIRVILGKWGVPSDCETGYSPSPNPLPLPAWTLNKTELARASAALTAVAATPPSECGAVACAIGHSVGAFPEDLAISPVGEVVMRKEAFPDPAIRINPSFHTMARFFDLTNEQLHWLFSHYSYSYTTVRILPKHVSERIRRLLICKGDVTKAVRSEPRSLVPTGFLHAQPASV